MSSFIQISIEYCCPNLEGDTSKKRLSSRIPKMSWTDKPVACDNWTMSDVGPECGSQPGSENAPAIFHIAAGADERTLRYSSSNMLVHASRDFLMSARVCGEVSSRQLLYCDNGVNQTIPQTMRPEVTWTWRARQTTDSTLQSSRVGLKDGGPNAF